MSRLTLRPMTATERDHYRDALRAGYVQQQVELGGFSASDAEERADSSMATHWPEGVPAQGHHVFVAEAEGQVVGRLWLAAAAPEPAVPGQAWIFDIEVEPEARGNGYGRDLMQAAVGQARALGCTSVGLNVFGGNDVAIRLYQSMGFRTRAMQMTLPL